MKRINIAHLEIALAIVAIAVGSFRAHVDLQVVGVLVLAAGVSAVIGMLEERKGRRREWCGFTVIILLGLGRHYAWRARWNVWSALLHGGIFLLVFAVGSLLLGKGRGANSAVRATALSDRGAP